MIATAIISYYLCIRQMQVCPHHPAHTSRNKYKCAMPLFPRCTLRWPGDCTRVPSAIVECGERTCVISATYNLSLTQLIWSFWYCRPIERFRIWDPSLRAFEKGRAQSHRGWGHWMTYRENKFPSWLPAQCLWIDLLFLTCCFWLPVSALLLSRICKSGTNL
jgi:hypothetical protein